MGIPCRENADLRKKILAFAEALKVEAHQISGHGLTEEEFYNSGLFRGAIERVRGQFSASMQEKRDLLKTILNRLEDDGLIRSWESSGGSNRHDYSVILPSGKIAVIELKGCLDGNNTNIFTRPPHAQEFVVWSVCTNPGADPRHNLWSGIHTRLGAEIIDRSQQIEGLVVWDMVCGTIGRPCPKLAADPSRVTKLGPYNLPPPCIYLFPSTIPSPRNNPSPRPYELHEVEFLSILAKAFGTPPAEAYQVQIEARYRGADLERRTMILKGGTSERASDWTPLRRA
jgi:DNA-binding PadR family transcriptional regulator